MDACECGKCVGQRICALATEDRVTREENDTGWAVLPVHVLEHIFDLLPMKNLGRCAQVCHHWADVVHSDYPWRCFEFRDGVFVRRKYTAHSGWQYFIDHWKLRFLITNAAPRWRHLRIAPVTNLFNLYEFIRVLTNFSEYYSRNEDTRPLAHIRSFRFEWRLVVAEDGEEHGERTIGTGGEMLFSLRTLMQHLVGLTDLQLVDLQLLGPDCDRLVEQLLEQFSDRLHSLRFVNATRWSRPVLSIGLFLNLRSLTLSPQHLSDDLLALLSDVQRLEEWTILQTEKTPPCQACSMVAWKRYEHDNGGRTWLRLKHTGRGSPLPLLLQPFAPVNSIVFGRGCGTLTGEMLQQITAFYSPTLHDMVQCGVDRWSRKKSNSAERKIDSQLVRLLSDCHLLELLAVKQTLCNGTAVSEKLLDRATPCRLVLRGNALKQRIGWRRSEHAIESRSSFDELRLIARDHDETRNLVNSRTRQPTIVSDKQYYAYYRD